MSVLVVSSNSVAVAKGLHVDWFNHTQHSYYEVLSNSKQDEDDHIVDMEISQDNKFLAIITSASKQLLLFETSSAAQLKSFTLPRSASKIRFSTDTSHLLVADKTGDVLSYEVQGENTNGVKLLGHLSLLLDILQTQDGKYVITSDRDEKIRVSCYPNTYNIQTYCLGHKEFVNHLELLPHNKEYLTSSSGDGRINIWNPIQGKLIHSIDTYTDINEIKLKEEFIKDMDSDGIQVQSLPIVHYTVSTPSQNRSIIAVTVYSYSKVLIYFVDSSNESFSHTLKDSLNLDKYPTAIKLHDSSLYLYNDEDLSVQVYEISDEGKCQAATEITMFKDKDLAIKSSNCDFIKVLYKRKFDNVQEYQERKKQRLLKTK